MAPLSDRSAKRGTQILVSHVCCPFTTPRVIVIDNGAEFRNAVVAEKCAQFQITHTFTAAYHPASNGLVERANRKLLDIIRPLITGLHDYWEDCLPQIAASTNSSVNGPTGKSQNHIIYGIEKRLPYDLLINTPQPTNNTEDYAQQQIHTSSNIHASVREKLKATKAEMAEKQHRRATPIKIKH